MERITLEYEPNNAFMQSYLATALLAGFKVVESTTDIQKKTTPFEKSLEDIKFGCYLQPSDMTEQSLKRNVKRLK
jgi:hypothetical protein